MGYNPLRQQIITVLMRRDGMDKKEAEELFHEAQLRVQEGEDPRNVCYEEFGLEPDYADALL